MPSLSSRTREMLTSCGWSPGRKDPTATIVNTFEEWGRSANHDPASFLHPAAMSFLVEYGDLTIPTKEVAVQFSGRLCSLFRWDSRVFNYRFGLAHWGKYTEHFGSFFGCALCPVGLIEMSGGIFLDDQSRLVTLDFEWVGYRIYDPYSVYFDQLAGVEFVLPEWIYLEESDIPDAWWTDFD